MHLKRQDESRSLITYVPAVRPNQITFGPHVSLAGQASQRNGRHISLEYRAMCNSGFILMHMQTLARAYGMAFESRVEQRTPLEKDISFDGNCGTFSHPRHSTSFQISALFDSHQQSWIPTMMLLSTRSSMPGE